MFSHVFLCWFFAQPCFFWQIYVQTLENGAQLVDQYVGEYEAPSESMESLGIPLKNQATKRESIGSWHCSSGAYGAYGGCMGFSIDRVVNDYVMMRIIMRIRVGIRVMTMTMMIAATRMTLLGSLRLPIVSFEILRGLWGSILEAAGSQWWWCDCSERGLWICYWDWFNQGFWWIFLRKR